MSEGGIMKINRKLSLTAFYMAFVYANGQHLFNENSPPILTLDRSWDIPVSEPVGSVITRVKAFDQENDTLKFGLEMIDPNRKNPFVINEDTGVVKLNNSLEKRGGEKFLMYVTVNDGHLTMKTEVFVNIKTTPGSKGPILSKSSRPPYYPTYLLPNPPIVPQSEVIPPPKILPPVEHFPKRKTDKHTTTTIKPTEETMTVQPPILSTKVNVADNSTDISSNDLAYMIIPTAIVCGVILSAALVAFLFRRRLCKYRSKIQKEEMRKDSHGGIISDDPIAMHHWRGPRAFSNRYEGWNRDRGPMPPPIQSDRDAIKTGDKWEFPRHHLKVFNILGEGCFGQVWRCEALNIDGTCNRVDDPKGDFYVSDMQLCLWAEASQTLRIRFAKMSFEEQTVEEEFQEVGEETEFSEKKDAARRESAPTSPRRPTEECAMKLPPKVIIEKLGQYYQRFVELRLELRDLEKEFGKLDRRRNRWRATEEELQLRLQKKKEIRKKSTEFDLINLKICKLQEAAQARDIKPADLPQEPPPLEEDEEDECLPDDILPRVIVCGTEKSGKMADVPKIVVCVDDPCKKPPEITEEENQALEEAEIMEEGGDGREGPVVVAVKTLKESAGEKERKDLLQELEVMKSLEPHPNIVRLLGCCTEKDPLFVIMEFVALGKLQSYLRNSRAERYYGNMHGESKTLTSRDLTSFAYQCARGMEFLSNKGIIHRDLAARNILVSNEQVCKVADFGFARDIIGCHVYERKSEGRLPIRWMAPESLYDNIFSVKSDVWGFGVLIWEIVTLGSTPYPGLAAADVMRKVRDGYRLEKPDHCRRELYNIMYYCWDKDPKERPSFSELVSLLEQLLLSETDYIELDRFPDHSYYNMVSLSGEKL